MDESAAPARAPTYNSDAMQQKPAKSRSDYDLTLPEDTERLFAEALPISSTTWPPKSAASAQTWRARPLLVRQTDDGNARPRAEPLSGRRQARARRDDLRKLETSRAEREFGFRAKTPFRKGIKETVAWYRQAGPEPATG